MEPGVEPSDRSRLASEDDDKYEWRPLGSIKPLPARVFKTANFILKMNVTSPDGKSTTKCEEELEDSDFNQSRWVPGNSPRSHQDSVQSADSNGDEISEDEEKNMMETLDRLNRINPPHIQQQDEQEKTELVKSKSAANILIKPLEAKATRKKSVHRKVHTRPDAKVIAARKVISESPLGVDAKMSLPSETSFAKILRQRVKEHLMKRQLAMKHIGETPPARIKAKSRRHSRSFFSLPNKEIRPL